MGAAGLNLAAVAVVFQQLGQRSQIIDAGLAAGDYHVACGITLLTHHRQQLLGVGAAPGVALFGFHQDPLHIDFPIGFLFPGMFGVAPAASYRAALQANKDGWNAGEKAFALQGLEHFINRVLHRFLNLER
ncbi:hypothetical protein D3C71_1706710 [compost metagenome]